MPKRVDHDQRRREITAAVVRITVKGGLQAATFREVAAEAGVSVRLIQYYFGTKDQLLLITQQHVAEQTATRFQSRMAAAGDDPSDALRALLMSFVPTDDASREAMTVFIALHTASLLDPSLARSEAQAVPRALHAIVADKLRAAGATSAAELDAEMLVALVPGVAQAVLDGMYTPEHAAVVIDHALGRIRGADIETLRR